MLVVVLPAARLSLCLFLPAVQVRKGGKPGCQKLSRCAPIGIVDFVSITISVNAPPGDLALWDTKASNLHYKCVVLSESPTGFIGS